MFDKLIESNSAEAEFKPRRKFFMVSSVVVGIAFLSAVVFSLYAQDLDLGTNEFELVRMVAPVDNNVPEPEPPREQQRTETSDEPRSELPSRQQLIARIDQSSQTPDAISSTPSPYREIPIGRFRLDPNADEIDGMGSTRPSGDRAGKSSAEVSEPTEPEATKVTEPPPVVKRESPPRIKSEGVINGKATYLPNPPYPRPAQMVGAEGIVNVQVTIDEDGKVISSKAVSGHPLLRQTAESAAWKARFTTTYLSRVPVKVTGMIVFNFKRN